MGLKTRQRTIARSVEMAGRGMFTGQQCRLCFRSAGPNTGVVFTRTDLDEDVRIPANVANVAKRARRTTLCNGTTGIETVEHVLSAVSGLGLDNLLIDAAGPEVPDEDGSARPFVEALIKAGVQEQDAEPKICVITEPITVTDGEATLTALPANGEYLDLLYDLDYPDQPGIGRQVFAFRLGRDDYATHLAPARTFLLKAEADQLRAQGLGPHLTERDILVMGNNGPIGNELRFKDEPVRHKLCDLIGDLSLLGRRLHGRIVGYKSGHALNHQLVSRLVAQLTTDQWSKQAIREPLLDIRHIQRILPHRYPFLMIDRVIELDGDRRAVGIKNVTINEPFFQGHYPGQPVMPGVLVLEAMAQLSGILLSRRLDNTGKVAMLVSMDRVKIRRAARPGDQLIIESESLHIRSRTGHCRCRAMIGDKLAAEAEIKFMLIDEDVG
ncbi:MAG: UDP-3-O-[3-hydroxymyristoyl] N-acetylglucosamine deacetylase [Planctomycetes bacterium]|nr:UDP-3-O-[3-hydroxymyristoyl] N-acetylglucosamine deacetylase [Planctomycetota bacterium]